MEKNARFALAAALSFLLPFSLFLFTCPPSVHVGDSGEFILAAFTLGNTHPPSSPLWCLITKLFTFIPVSNIAWRVTLSSAFYSSLAALFLFLLLNQLSRSPWIGLAVSVLFATQKTVWFISTMAKNYALVLLIVMLLITLIHKWLETGRPRYLYAASFVLGSGITVHFIMLEILPLFAYLVLYKKIRYKLRFSVFLTSVLFLSGFLFYIYLPLRARTSPPVNCGNPSTLSSFLITVTRAQFGRYTNDVFLGVYLPIRPAGLFSLSRLGSALFNSGKVLLNEFGWLFSFLGIAGVIGLHKRQRSLFYFSLAVFLMSLFVYILLTDSRLSPEVGSFIDKIPALIIFCVWIGFGLNLVMDLLLQKRFLRNALLVCIAAWWFFAAFRNYGLCNKRSCTLAPDYGMNIMNSLDKDAILISEGSDIMGILAYLQICEKVRPDVALVDRLNNLLEHYYNSGSTMNLEEVDQVRFDVERDIISKIDRPVYYTFDSERDAIRVPGIRLQQQGLVYRVVRNDADLKDNLRWRKYLMRGIDNPSFLKEPGVAKLVSEYYWHMGEFFIGRGEDSQGWLYLKKAQDVNHGANPHMSYNLAAWFLKWGKPEEAMQEVQKSLALNPTSLKLYYLMGNIYTSVSRPHEAIEAYAKLAQMKPLPFIYDELAMLHFNLGDARQAKECALLSLQMDAENDFPHLVLGLVYAAENKKEEAQRELKEALRINPKNDRAQKVLQEYN
jgi:tetratricopeptide (TPR) repeat protein